MPGLPGTPYVTSPGLEFDPPPTTKLQAMPPHSIQ